MVKGTGEGGQKRDRSLGDLAWEVRDETKQQQV